METYYGQMTKEQLCGVCLEVVNAEHSADFQEMCFSVGVGWPDKKVMHTGSRFLSALNYGNGIELAHTTGSFDHHKLIKWLPESERPSSDLKSKLAEAIAKRDKRKAKLQKAADKLEQAEKEVQRLIAELENEFESIGGISCKIAEMTKPDIPEGVDVDDPTTWQKGDIVCCVSSGGSQLVKTGNKYAFSDYGFLGMVLIVDDNDGAPYWIDSTAKFRFVRRP